MMDIIVSCQFQVIERYVRANYFGYNEELLHFKPYYLISALIELLRGIFGIANGAPVDIHINLGE